MRTSCYAYASSSRLSDLPLPDSSARDVGVVAEVLEALKGSYANERVAFVQHGHGFPEYEKETR